MSEDQHDFIFGINVPINRPKEEELKAISGSLEDHFQHLIDQGFMTLEEAVAYVKFSTQMSSFVPFMLDGFLKSYRENIKKLEEEEES